MKITGMAVLSMELAILMFCQSCRDKEQRMRESGQRSAMTTYANGLRQNCSTRKKEQEQMLATLREDATRLSSFISPVTAKKNDEESRETRLLNALGNPDVNALALKYLGSDFSGIRDDFSARVHEVLAAEAKYADAVKEVEDMFSANSKRAATLTDKTMSQRDVEMKRLRSELQALEKNRITLQEEYKSFTARYATSYVNRGTSQKNEELKRKEQAVFHGRLYDLDSQIAKKRLQIDSLTSPDAIRKFEKEILSSSQQLQREAYSGRDNALKDIDRRLKPKKSSAELIAEFEAKSVTKLRTAIAAKIGECEKRVALLTDKLAAIDEFILSIPVSDIQDLDRRKTKISN